MAFVPGKTTVSGTINAPIADVWKLVSPFSFNYGYYRWEIIGDGQDAPGARRYIQRTPESTLYTEQFDYRDDGRHELQFHYVDSDPPVEGLDSLVTTMSLAPVKDNPRQTTATWLGEWSVDPSLVPEVRRMQKRDFQEHVNFVSTHFANVNQKLSVNLVSGANLESDKSNPSFYAVISFGQIEESRVSKTIQNTSPHWDQEFTFDISQKTNRELKIDVFEHDQKSSQDSPVGNISYDLSSLDVLKRTDIQLNLENAKSGTVNLQVYVNAFLQDWETEAHQEEDRQKMIIEFLQYLQETLLQVANNFNESEEGPYKYADYSGEYKGLPRMIEGLPYSKALNPQKLSEMTRRIYDYLYSITDFYTRYEHLNPNNWLEVYSTVYYHRYIKPPVSTIRNWERDDEFCRQYIQGLNPLIISKVFPSTPVSDELKELTSNGKTFNDMLKEGRLFIVDYYLLDGIPLHLDMFFYAPIVLLENTPKGLKILGIQLTRDKDTKNEVFTPDSAKTHPNRYLFAKMHVACADIQVHEFAYHLGLSHLLMEPFAIAHYNVWDKRFSDHKLGKLMEPHFKDNIGINYLARAALVSPRYALTDNTFSIGSDGGLKIALKLFKEWDFPGYSFPGDLRNRGFTEDGSDGVKDYYYRDDGFKIWYAIKDYVQTVVHELYENDKSVANDPAIHAWYEEVTDPARANIPSFPKIETRNDLIESITTIIFTCSAQHSAVNYPQYEYVGFIPNRPDALFRPMPAKQIEDLTDNFIASALPTVYVTHFQVSITHLLTTPPEKDDLLSELAATRNVFPNAHKRFMKDLRKVSAEINERNAALEKQGKTPYPWLLPDRINSSIAI